MSQIELARRLGMSPSPVNNIERGRNLPSASVLCKLANVLAVPVDAFFIEEEVPARAPYGYVGAPDDTLPGTPRARVVRRSLDGAECAPRLLEHLGQLCDCVLALEDMCGAQKRAEIPLTIPFEFSESGIGLLVERVRAVMGVGHAVIFDHVELFENLGLRILFTSLPPALDSISCYDETNANAFVFIRSGMTVERQLFRLSYELGRIYCLTRSRHLGAPNIQTGKPRRQGKPLNDHRASRYFSAVFMQPAELVRATVRQVGVAPDAWSFDLLLRLKHRFGVSAESFLYRLDELELIQPELRQTFQKRIAAHYSETDYSEPDGSMRILTPNARLGDLLMRASSLSDEQAELSHIRRTLQACGIDGVSLPDGKEHA